MPELDAVPELEPVPELDPDPELAVDPDSASVPVSVAPGPCDPQLAQADATTTSTIEDGRMVSS